MDIIFNNCDAVYRNIPVVPGVMQKASGILDLSRNSPVLLIFITKFLHILPGLGISIRDIYICTRFFRMY